MGRKRILRGDLSNYDAFIKALGYLDVITKIPELELVIEGKSRSEVSAATLENRKNKIVKANNWGLFQVSHMKLKGIIIKTQIIDLLFSILSSSFNLEIEHCEVDENVTGKKFIKMFSAHRIKSFEVWATNPSFLSKGLNNLEFETDSLCLGRCNIPGALVGPKFHVQTVHFASMKEAEIHKFMRMAAHASYIQQVTLKRCELFCKVDYDGYLPETYSATLTSEQVTELFRMKNSKKLSFETVLNFKGLFQNKMLRTLLYRQGVRVERYILPLMKITKKSKFDIKSGRLINNNVNLWNQEEALPYGFNNTNF